jgi:uncharacterized protein (DUF952 family)
MKNIYMMMPAVFLTLLALVSCGDDTASSTPEHLYKVTTGSLWKQSRQLGYLALAPTDAYFIHLSEKEDVDKIIDKYFPTQKTVVVLELDPSHLQGDLVKEVNPGGTKKYYHLYNGKIPLKAVVNVEFRKNPDVL